MRFCLLVVVCGLWCAVYLSVSIVRCLLCVACCVVFDDVVHCVMAVVCCLVCDVWCLLCVVRCFGVCCALRCVRCLFCVVCSMLFVGSCLMFGAR